MTRRLKAALYLAGLVTTTACAWPSPERQLLLDFFQACRVYDTTVLSRLATVPCNPRTDGVVQDFDLVQVDRFPGAANVTIRARVRSFDGQLSQHTLAVSIEQHAGRWMVTRLTPPPASQTSRAASSDQPN